MAALRRTSDTGWVYLLDHGGYDGAPLEQLVTNEAGCGALQTAPKQRLLALRGASPRALARSTSLQQAYQWLGALAAVLGGLDALGLQRRHRRARRRGAGAHLCRNLGHLGSAR